MAHQSADPKLSTYFRPHRRYARSVNLERDLDDSGAAEGYVLTERSGDALRRILSAIAQPRAHRAWTITGVYGTGKSAFAHYLAALCAPKTSKIYQAAIAQASFASDDWSALVNQLPPQGLVRAVATGRQEPLCWTIARALINGAASFWADEQCPELKRELIDWQVELETGHASLTDGDVLRVLKAFSRAANTSLLLVVDELGKNLEFACHHQGVSDLYLLQQIAELSADDEQSVYFLGILHQSFAGYSDRLTSLEQSQWNKIQGRFEDILLTESPSQMMRLIGQAIDCLAPLEQQTAIAEQAAHWAAVLTPMLAGYDLSPTLLAATYPLHPLSALVLPLLCTRYGQNDRSLFTFLTSSEPYGLWEFLRTATLTRDTLPTLQLHQVYDYFVESIAGLASRVNLQRWVEIRGLIQDAEDYDPDVVKVLKTIGVLNLVTTNGQLRATPHLVALALCDRPDQTPQVEHWHHIIQDLCNRGIITHRQPLDELRLWQGSDVDIEAAITDTLERETIPLADLLVTTHPLKPVVAQRHYTTTGTLRYFEQRYLDSRTELTNLTCSHHSFDGLIVYWLDRSKPETVPSYTQDGKPLVVVQTNQLEILQMRAQALYALQRILQTVPELQHDKVARREVRHRWGEANRLLDETVAQAFSPGQQCQYWVEGKVQSIATVRMLQSTLSDLCDRTYSQGLILDNELINLRELTTQGAKARRELIEAMLARADQERLGLSGYGPEVAMYVSVLAATQIHRQEQGRWGFYPPAKDSGVWTVWQAIEQFCISAREKQRSLADLYHLLSDRPYGVKAGVIPLLLVAVLIYHADNVSFYKDGSFLPFLSPEQFELLVKRLFVNIYEAGDTLVRG
ncbi:MAG: hypothetical protein NZ772_02060 [Cyanobacteria bacterium]|nr:hypothetical protein [Cyanobacteriota bacterium]MDW8200281.1 hypothetical protein [Cyanobacteriota bacterium SKYGB_h_bin112]